MTLKVTSGFAALTCVIGAAAQADEVIADDLIVNNSGSGLVCIGEGCINGESSIDPVAAVIELKDNRNMIHFNDISNDGNNFPKRDWLLKANDDFSNELDRFYLVDLGTNNIPFDVRANAPDAAFVVSSTGGIGLGTAMPDFDLHMVGASLVVATFEGTSDGNQKWNVGSNTATFFIEDKTAGTVPFIIAEDAPTDAIYIEANGNIGMGTGSPDAPLELSSGDAFNFFRISATGATVNDSVDITFTGGPLGTGQLRYNIVDGDNQEMSLDADGNVVIDGTLTTAGPTCAGGCDRVFDADYALPSITEHAQQMFDLGYLPSIGATVPHAPVNVTEKLGNTINSLEHAHIYISQLQSDQQTQADIYNARIAQLEVSQAALVARLEALEAQ